VRGCGAREIWIAYELIDLRGGAIKPWSFAALRMTAEKSEKQIPRSARNDSSLFTYKSESDRSDLSYEIGDLGFVGIAYDPSDAGEGG
jgi:hypothetical protein